MSVGFFVFDFVVIFVGFFFWHSSVEEEMIGVKKMERKKQDSLKFENEHRKGGQRNILKRHNIFLGYISTNLGDLCGFC